MRMGDLAKHQISLIESVMAAPRASEFHLIAPPGSGKTSACAGLISAIKESDASANVLLVTPVRMLAEQYLEALIRLGKKERPILLDRRQFRELAQSATASISPQHSQSLRGIVIVPAHLLDRPEITSAILENNWRLVIADEYHDLKPSALQFLHELRSQRATPTFLFTSATPPPDVKSRSNAQIINWAGLFSQSRAPRTERIQIPYTRTQEEVQLFHRLRDFLSEESNSLPSQAILRAFSSSILAGEQSLRVYRNSLAHSAIQTLSENALRTIGELLDGCTSLDFDSKLEAMELFLVDFESRQPNSRTCVFSHYLATTNYLSESFGFRDGGVWSLNAQTRASSAFDALNAFRQQGGLLFISDAALRGFELPNCDLAIFYDLPHDSRIEQIRTSRIANVNSGSPLRIAIPQDSGETLPEEFETSPPAEDS